MRYKSEHFSIDEKTDDEIIHEVVDKLNDSRFSDKKRGFLTEQLSLVFTPPNGRRYSSSLLAMSVMWQQISKNKCAAGKRLFSRVYHKWFEILADHGYPESMFL